MADLSYSAFKPDRKRTPCFPTKTFSFFLCDFQIHKLRIDQRIALIAAANLHPFFKCRAALVQWVDDDEVGLLSHLERTQPVVDVQEPRAFSDAMATASGTGIFRVSIRLNTSCRSSRPLP